MHRGPSRWRGSICHHYITNNSTKNDTQIKLNFYSLEMSTRSEKVPDVVRIPPYHYIHVLDQNSNVSRLESGPQVFVRKDNEKIITGVMKYITIPPRHYCTLRNPVVKESVSHFINYISLRAREDYLSEVSF